jgi:hypothetical protein
MALSEEDLSILRKIWELPPDAEPKTVCDAIATALAPIKTQLRATAILVRLMNETIEEE